MRSSAATFDVVTARTETYAAPGALPDVRPGATIEQDLARRDFTVNAIALRVADGALAEWPGAQEDLRAGVLRVLHERSFEDDPTRLLRMARYAARLGFEPDPATDALAAAATVETVSGARLGSELRLLLREPQPAALLALERHGLGRAVVDPSFRADAGLIERARELCPPEARADLAGLAAALVDAGPLRAALDRLEFDARLAGDRREGRRAAAGATGSATPGSGWRCATRRPRRSRSRARSGRPRRRRRWLADVRHRRLAITGDDFVAAGLERPGGRRRAGGGAARRCWPARRRAPPSSSRPGWPRCVPRRIGPMDRPTLEPPFRWEGEHIAAELPGARALFTSRHGGVSPAPFDSLNLGRLTDDAGTNVDANRERLAAAVGLPRERFLYGRQVHGARVRRASEPPGPERPAEDEDGQATALRDAAALVFAADCLPIVLAAGGAVAALHGGWGGLAGGIVAEGVLALREVGGEGPVSAAIGPCARGCCYEVGEDRFEHFAHVPEARVGERNLDLPAVARHDLAEAGVAEVHDLGLCTICRPDLFFSHRADGGVTGRQAGVVWRA